MDEHTTAQLAAHHPTRPQRRLVWIHRSLPDGWLPELMRSIRCLTR